MADIQEPTIVTVDDGTGPVKAIKDAAGRIITATQVQKIRQAQDSDLQKVSAIRDQLVAGDTPTADLIVNQTRDEISRRLASLEIQRANLQDTLDKIKTGDAKVRQDIVSQMTDRLNARVQLMTDSRDRSDQLLGQLGVSPSPVDITPGPSPVETRA